MEKYGGIDRTYDRSTVSKLIFALLHGVVVAVCIWLAFGDFGWSNEDRAAILALCAVLYWARHCVTLFVLLQRKVELSEVLGLSVFIALFEIGFILLGAGWVHETPVLFGWFDWLGIGLLLVGSYLNTGSELQRKNWKKQPSSKGKCYTSGLFSHSMHINYFGDSLLFTGWALLTASIYAFSIPVLMTAMFVFHHIPALDAYLAERYGDAFKAYADKTAKFVPFVY